MKSGGGGGDAEEGTTNKERIDDQETRLRKVEAFINWMFGAGFVCGMLLTLFGQTLVHKLIP